MKTKNLITTLSCLLLLTNAYAMGSKKSGSGSSNSGGSTTTPVVTTPPKEETPVDSNPLNSAGNFWVPLSENEYLDNATRIGRSVDDSQNSSQLVNISRDSVNEDRVDGCMPQATLDHNHFADQIAYYTNILSNDFPAKVGLIGSYYSSSSNDANYFPVSLVSHPMCNVTSTTLAATVKKVPGAATITKLNNFANKMNGLRLKIIEGSEEAKKEYHAEWTKLFSCLAYTESLSTADAASSKNVASSVAPSGYRKPAGVKFYNDPAQDAASRLNIGMFQFTPNAGGNIQACIRGWNELQKARTSCQVSQTASKAELIKVLGSSYQSFNTFCGIHKVLQTYAIQVNTTGTGATHPNNKVSGKLKPSNQRCVSLHFQAGKAYNHFGPFQNSTGSNLDKLFSCVQNSNH